MTIAQTLPNVLSLSRIPIGGLIILVYSDKDLGQFIVALCLLLLALLTDVVDGYLARKLGIASDHGYLLDGLGDRAVYLAVILTFYAGNELWGLAAWLLILREVTLYAVRVVQTEWSIKLAETRMLSLCHAFVFRLWVGLILTKDGLQIMGTADLDDLVGIKLASSFLIIGSLSAGYLSVYATLAPMFKDSE